MKFQGDVSGVRARWCQLAQRCSELDAKCKELGDSNPQEVIDFLATTASLLRDLIEAAESDLVDGVDKLETLASLRDPDVRGALEAAGPRLREMWLFASIGGVGLLRSDVEKIAKAASKQLGKLTRRVTRIAKSAERQAERPGQNQRTTSARAAATGDDAENFQDRYTNFRRLGEGVFGEVWVADDSVLLRRVAIKIIRASVGDLDAIAHARALARVKHPNIVAVHDVAAIRDPTTGSRVHAVIMELVEGPTLAEAMGQRMSASEARRIGNALLDAIGAYHATGLAHMDLHDGNVVVGEAVKVIDPLYIETALFASTTSREQRQQRDLRQLRDLLGQMLLLGAVPLEDAHRFERETAQPTLELLRAKFGEALQGFGAISAG